MKTIIMLLVTAIMLTNLFSCNKEHVEPIEPIEEEPEDVSDSLPPMIVGGIYNKYVYVYEDQQLIESDYSITFPPEGGTKELNIVFPASQTIIDLCIFGEGGDIPSITYKKISKPTIFPSAPVREDEINYIQLISITAKENTTSETISHTLEVYSNYYNGYGMWIHITQEPMTVVDE